MPPQVNKKGDAKPSRTESVNSNAFVYVEKSMTKKIGEFESARIVVGMQLPIDYTQNDLDKASEAINVVSEIVEDKLVEEMEIVLKENGL